MAGAISPVFWPPSPARTASPSRNATNSARFAGRCRDPADQRQDLAFHIFGRQRADLAKADVAAAVDDVGLRHAVNPEIDRRAAGAINPDTAIGVPETVEKTARVLRLVLVGYPFEGDARSMRQRHQLRVLFTAGDAP